MFPPKTILIVDDDKDTCELVTFVFQREGFQVKTHYNSEDGLSCSRQGGFALIILDYNLSGMDGMELCREIRGFDRKTPIIFFSAEARPKKIEKALAQGAQLFITKPVDVENLKKSVLEVIQKHE